MQDNNMIYRAAILFVATLQIKAPSAKMLHRDLPDIAMA
jgi:hypothetical protein